MASARIHGKRAVASARGCGGGSAQRQGECTKASFLLPSDAVVVVVAIVIVVATYYYEAMADIL